MSFSLQTIRAAGLALLTLPVLAQTTAPKEVIANGGLLHALLAAPVVGEPFSAVQTHQTKQTLADGTNITHHGHHSLARDAEGRFRVEVRMANGQNGKPDTVMVFVMDPVAHTLTTFMTGGNGPRVATVAKVPKTERKEAAPAKTSVEVSDRPQPVVTMEDLGSDIVQGQPVTVLKVTTVIPPGRSGNDAPITKTHEIWTSPDLKLILKEQWEDPRSGERTIELDKLSRMEPDPALFRAPAGYQVKDALETLKEMQEKLNSSLQN